jgi:hypothetical protein
MLNVNLFTESPIALDSLMNTDMNSSYTSLGGPVFMGSFPVDVIVFLRVEPSIIRFNCLPESRVECLLQVCAENM